MFTRHSLNPLISPSSMPPSQPGWEIIGTFNAGAAQMGSETVLLVRVAERPLAEDPGWVLAPMLNTQGELTIRHLDRADPDWDFSDPRVVHQRSTGAVFLTSISHFRRARSTDGVRFTLDAQPWMSPQTALEAFGVEDARITPLDDQFIINYTAVSPYGIATGIARTRDFDTVERMGIIFPPANRDVTIFPQKINGLYATYHRPMPGDFGRYAMWLATSPDLLRWGDHRMVLEGGGPWEAGRIGGGAPPLWTEDGWLVLYHAADRDNRYCLGAFLVAHDDPARVIARTTTPILSPEASYEAHGFFGGVVFTCGAVIVGDTLRIYYGAADEHMALAEAPLKDVLAALKTD